MKYTKGYKYHLEEGFSVAVPIKGLAEYKWITLDHDVLHIDEGYPWDGPSGPTIDTRNSMIAALTHDAFYELMRRGKLGIENRRQIDKLMYTMLRQEGMSWLRAKLWYRALRKYARSAALPSAQKKVHTIERKV